MAFFGKFLDPNWNLICFGEFVQFLSQNVNPWTIIGGSAAFDSESGAFAYRTTVFKFLWSSMNHRLCRSVFHIMNTIHGIQTEYYKSIFTPGQQWPFLIQWSDYDDFVALANRILDEAWSTPSVMRRLGFSGKIEVVITALERTDLDNCSDDQTVLWLHFKTTLHATKQFFIFGAPYQTWPWSSVKMFGSASQEAAELKYLKRVDHVTRTLESDPREVPSRSPHP
jgi:hypothetical protein